VQVAARQADAAQVQLAGHAGGHGLQAAVQDIGCDIGDRATDGRVRCEHRHGGVAIVDHVPGRPDGDLGGAVRVDEAPARGPGCHHIGRAGLACRDDGAQFGQGGWVQQAQHRRRQGDVGDVPGLQRARQELRR